MLGGIACQETTNYSADFVKFKVDESDYTYDLEREIGKDTTLNGTVITTDWALPEGKRTIALTNVNMSQDDYELLRQFKEDTSVVSWVFAYKNDCWDVLIQTLAAVYNGRDGGYSVSINLSVISRLTGATDALLS